MLGRYSATSMLAYSRMAGRARLCRLRLGARARPRDRRYDRSLACRACPRHGFCEGTPARGSLARSWADPGGHCPLRTALVDVACAPGRSDRSVRRLYTSKSKSSPARGLSSLLFGELARIRDLYRRRRGSRLQAPASNNPRAVLWLDGPCALLRSAVSGNCARPGTAAAAEGTLMVAFRAHGAGPRIKGACIGTETFVRSPAYGRPDVTLLACSWPRRRWASAVARVPLRGVTPGGGRRPLIEELALACTPTWPWPVACARGASPVPRGVGRYRNCLIAQARRRDLIDGRENTDRGSDRGQYIPSSISILGIGHTERETGPPQPLLLSPELNSSVPKVGNRITPWPKIRFDQASKLSPEAKERLSLFGDTIANCDRVIDLSLAPAFTRVSPPSPIDLALSYNLKVWPSGTRTCVPALTSRRRAVALALRRLPSGAGGAPPAEPRVVPGFLAPDHCLVPAELGSPPRLSLVRGAVQKPQRTKASPPSGVDVQAGRRPEAIRHAGLSGNGQDLY